jgi:hypothetical protein
MSDIPQRYIETWNETDPERRRAALARLYTESATYTDPHVELRGVREIDAFIASTQERFPGMQFTLAGGVDAHHNLSRFNWQAGPAGADEPLAVGFDVIVMEDGRVREVCGFIDKAPA